MRFDRTVVPDPVARSSDNCGNDFGYLRRMAHANRRFVQQTPSRACSGPCARLHQTYYGRATLP